MNDDSFQAALERLALWILAAVVAGGIVGVVIERWITWTGSVGPRWDVPGAAIALKLGLLIGLFAGIISRTVAHYYRDSEEAACIGVAAVTGVAIWAIRVAVVSLGAKNGIRPGFDGALLTALVSLPVGGTAAGFVAVFIFLPFMGLFTSRR